MIKPLQYRRLALMGLMLVLAFAGLGYRLVVLQVNRHEYLTIKASERQKRVLQAPRRGEIFDANGIKMAGTVFVKTVIADPSMIGTNHALVARTLAPLLEMDAMELDVRLRPRKRLNKDGKEVAVNYVRLKRRVTMDRWEQIKAAMASFNPGVDESTLSRKGRVGLKALREKAIAVDAMDDQMRVYPNGALASHVLGFVGTDEGHVDGLASTDLKGRDGVEATFDSALSGTVGWKDIEVDSRKREMAIFRDQEVAARPGLNVVLTLDARVQRVVEAELAAVRSRYGAVSASAVVVRPRTGEIVAMATAPTFDPNQPGRDTPIANLRNRVISDITEPGSTFKAVVVSAALNEGRVKLNERFHCENGSFLFAGRRLRDAEHAYGELTVEEIIAKSSNIGAAKIGMRLGAESVHSYIRKFGFAARTGIHLPGEVAGILHPVAKWYKVSIAQIPMGQGLAVTPLQMTLAIAAVANGGRLMRPLIVSRLEDEDGNCVKQYPPERVREVVGPSAAALMVQAMTSAITSGTGTAARLDHYTVAGKTGTAQKPPYGNQKYLASFIGFLPAGEPELCIGVFVDEPDPSRGYYGGKVAAPVFKSIAERAAVQLGIRPDLLPAPEPMPAARPAYTDAGRPAQLTAPERGRNF